MLQTRVLDIHSPTQDSILLSAISSTEKTDYINNLFSLIDVLFYPWKVLIRQGIRVPGVPKDRNWRGFIYGKSCPICYNASLWKITEQIFICLQFKLLNIFTFLFICCTY